MTNIEQIKIAAENNNADAQYTLSLYYNYGNVIEKNPAKSIEWLKKSAINGHKYAQYRLGNIYEAGLDTEKNIEEAIKWYTMAADTIREARDRLNKCQKIKINRTYSL
jgi:TPR repeat protein